MGGKLFIVVALVAGSYFLGLGKLVGIGSDSKGLAGETYTQIGTPEYQDENGEPVRFGFHFLDGKTVNMLANGKKLRNTMNYRVEGEQILLTHPEGSHLDLELAGDGHIYQPNSDWYFDRN